METLTETPVIAPKPGALWPEQGGRYVGSYVKDGVLYHGISAIGVENDIKASFNTLDKKIKGIPAINGFTDWRAPDQREKMLTYVHTVDLPDEFIRKGIDSIYLTSTPYGSYGAWIVYFEGGYVYVDGRSHEFRFRPFRSIVA